MINAKLIIDFDSTFIKIETLDALADIVFEDCSNKHIIINKIKKITSKAMRGDIPFDRALSERIKLLNAKKENINQTISLIKNNISNTVISNKKFFLENSKHIYIVSGGFKEIILPIVKTFGIKQENIFANNFKYDDSNHIKSIDKKNLLSKDKGKVYALKELKNKLNSRKKYIIIGDGYTDYELKKYKEVDIFIQYIENINRKSLNEKADIIANDFNEVINYIEKIKC